MSTQVSKVVAFTDFSGGLNTDASTYKIKDNESPDLLNIRLNPVGPISGRYGSALLNTVAEFESDKAVVSMFRYRPAHVLGVVAMAAAESTAPPARKQPCLLLTSGTKLVKIEDPDDPDTFSNLETYDGGGDYYLQIKAFFDDQNDEYDLDFSLTES